MKADIKLISSIDLEDLVRRMDLLPQLLRRQQEDIIAELVPVNPQEIDQAEQQLLGGSSRDQWLLERGWTEDDLRLHLKRPLALKCFARQQFGPGVEEKFLASRDTRDQIVYSLLRVRDSGLARELYLRITEQELAFPEAASEFGEGPEARHQGVIGPLSLGKLQPEQLADCLRSLQPNEIHRPVQFGEWHLILRLDHLSTSRLDKSMRATILEEQLNDFLDERVRRYQSGEPLEAIHFDDDAQEAAE